MIDSEQVPWGKGEKHPGEGDEIVSETVYLQAVGALSLSKGDGVPIEEWANEFIYVVCLIPHKGVGEAKASQKLAYLIK